VFAGQTKQLDAAWELLKWLIQPENNAVQVKALGHVVTGVVKASDIRRKEWQQETGTDPQAWILQAGYSRYVGWGIYKYPQAETVARSEITPRYDRELLTGAISVNEFCEFAEQKLKQAVAAGR
jgi:ABC-type glycerol-3-phosphate transport system substrate-binding protein